MHPVRHVPRLRYSKLLACALLAGCYSSSLLTTPEPTPVGKVHATTAVALQRAPPGAEAEGIIPFLEGAVRVGLHERFDLGLKGGPLYVELNSMLRLWHTGTWTLSIMPAFGNTWMWEAPGSKLGHSQSSRLMGPHETATKVIAAKVPLLLAWRGPRDRVSFVFGPTLHAGYRYCRSVSRSTLDASGEQVSVETCVAADRGGWLAVGGHLSLPITLGTFVRLIPELSILGIPAAPRAREVAAGEVRTNFSEGDLVTHFAFGVQLGRFAPRARAANDCPTPRGRRRRAPRELRRRHGLTSYAPPFVQLKSTCTWALS